MKIELITGRELKRQWRMNMTDIEKQKTGIETDIEIKLTDTEKSIDYGS